VIPALVWTFKNNQRGFTRNVSSLVILMISFATGRLAVVAACDDPAATLGTANWTAPKPINPAAPFSTARRCTSAFLGLRSFFKVASPLTL
jgi:hypothetical protein